MTSTLIIRFCCSYVLWMTRIWITSNDYGEQGWPSGESTRLPPIWPRFDYWIRRHNVDWVCWFSTLFQEVFPRGSPVFPSYQKPTLEFVLLWFNLICTWPHKLFSFKHYRVKIKVIIIKVIIITGAWTAGSCCRWEETVGIRV